MSNPDNPQFPLKVVFHEDQDEWTLATEDEAACNLEWFDSSSSDENATVTDSLGRKVHLVVEKLEMKLCVLA